ncbi:MAG: hypothetical protein DHS20C20_21100 [Ardenticatenaceae bacterium]|nr:MAG: hypothetical protein DHS20C20_21100 [Ardenticatenaceae bacterium]
MKIRLIRVLNVLFLICVLVLTASCQTEDPPPVAPLNPSIEQINDSDGAEIIDQPVVTPEEQPSDAFEVQETPEEEIENIEETTQAVEAPPEVVEEAPPVENAELPEVGSTVEHKVQAGDWLMQIARCYGADYTAVRRANPQLVNPNRIMPDVVVTVPNVGSAGDVHGAPCVAEYTVAMGDTWLGLAEQFDTTAVILQRVNPGRLLAADTIIVPAHATETESE